ncbi:MBL fold metallo-hydrolase [Sulfurimonas sp. SAG-AH-194-C21]|nr:MBL fold metallo-hydrolase [Sulfurimonas sp. SAG-AH-194-C21]MDF1883470.1 MBL fold metallo-hydrolase [Sulfurimonas sp. SAG-AH-194-C21]
MKTLLSILLLCFTLFSFDYQLKPVQIGSSSVHCFFGLSEVMNDKNNGNMANSCFVNMGNSYIVIDSGPTYLYASQAYEHMQNKANLKVKYVFNTHVHDDHWLGNGYYKDQGAKLIGSSAFKDLEIEAMPRMKRRISAEAYKLTTQVHPKLFVDEEMILYLEQKKVIIKNTGHRAHTDSDIYVYIPSQKIVFVGDLVFNDRLPSIRDGNLKGWLGVLDEILQLDVDYIVGGHGKIVSRDSVTMTYEYLKTLRDEVLRLMDDGEDIGEVVNIVTMDKFKNLNLYDSMHRQNVETAYRMLEWEN